MKKLLYVCMVLVYVNQAMAAAAEPRDNLLQRALRAISRACAPTPVDRRETNTPPPAPQAPIGIVGTPFAEPFDEKHAPSLAADSHEEDYHRIIAKANRHLDDWIGCRSAKALVPLALLSRKCRIDEKDMWRQFELEDKSAQALNELAIYLEPEDAQRLWDRAAPVGGRQILLHIKRRAEGYI